MPLELDTWPVPGDSRRGTHWGEGLLARPADGAGPAVFLRFYEWNVFGAAQPAIHSRADKSQAHVTSCGPDGRRGEVTYPAHGIDLFAEVVDDAVALTLRVENRTRRDWPPVAGLIPCLNPGRDRADDPVSPGMADPTGRNSYFPGGDGVARLEGRKRHLVEAARPLLEAHRPEDGVPDRPPWYEVADRAAAEPLVLRESENGEWATGIGFEAGLWVQGHNPWNCLHLCIRVGPLAAGETAEYDGRLYLQAGGREALLDRYRTEFG